MTRHLLATFIVCLCIGCNDRTVITNPKESRSANPERGVSTTPEKTLQTTSETTNDVRELSAEVLRTLQSKIGEDASGAPIQEADTQQDPGTAENALGEGVDKSLEAQKLIGVFNDENARMDERETAVLQLGRLKPIPAVAIQALAAAMESPERTLQFSAGDALRDIGQKAIPVLVSILDKSTNSDARISASRALEDLALLGLLSGEEAPRVVPVLIEMLNDENVQVAIAATKILRRIGPDARAAAPALLRLLGDESNAALASRAASALGGIGSVTDAIVPALMGATISTIPDVRVSAVEALGDIGPDARAALPALIRTLRECEDEDLRDAVVRTLGSIGPATDEVIPALIEAAKSTDEDVRNSAVDALGYIGPRAGEAVPTLTEMLRKSVDTDLRNSIQTAIEEIGGKQDASSTESGQDIEALTLLIAKQHELFVEGRYADAAGVAKQILTLTGEKLGKEHPAYATSLSTLAALHVNMEDYTEAESLYKQSMEIQRKALGENHPDYIGNLDALATMYALKGDYVKAEPLFKQAMETSKKVLGEDDPGYATRLENLGNLYALMGDVDRAAPLITQARAIKRGILGESKPD